MVSNWFSEISRFVIYAILFVVLLVAYGFILQQIGIIPIGGKKAPTFVFLLFFQWWYVFKFPSRNQGEKKHFLVYFVLQYILILVTATFSALFLHYFFQTGPGLHMLDGYIQQSLLELNGYKEVIVSQEGESIITVFMTGLNQLMLIASLKMILFKKLH